MSLTALSPLTAQVQRFGLEGKLPAAVESRLRDGLQGAVADTPKPGHAAFEKTLTTVVGNNALAVAMAEERARELGFSTLVSAPDVLWPLTLALAVYTCIQHMSVCPCVPVC